MKKLILYIKFTNIIGGIETFMYNFCISMYKDYDITVMANVMAEEQSERLKPFVKVITGDVSMPIECDTLLMMRMIDPIPKNIK